MSAAGLQVLPVHGIGEVVPGADLADLIAGAAPWLRDGDVLVVTSKIVSKAEGRLVEVPRTEPERTRAYAETVGTEAARTVATRGETRIVATHHGFVMASAGVDSSNVDPSYLVLLPKDPDASARALRAALVERHQRRVAVVISDTMGRPWRNGLTDLALGAAGIAPLRDYRGQTDPYGNELQLTQVAIVDELAAAAELVKGKRDQVPVAVVRGLAYPAVEDDPAAGEETTGVVAALVRDHAADLFSLGSAEARAAGLRAAATLPDPPPADLPPPDLLVADLPQPGLRQADPPPASPPVDLAAVRRAMATVTPHLSGTMLDLVPEPAAVRCAAPDPTDPAALVRLGADAHRVRAALAAEGVGSVPELATPGTVLVKLWE